MILSRLYILPFYCFINIILFQILCAVCLTISITDTRGDDTYCGESTTGESKNIINELLPAMMVQFSKLATPTTNGLMSGSDKVKLDGLLPPSEAVVFGTVTGNNDSQRTITLGFTPRAVLYMDKRGGTYSINGSALSSATSGGLAITGTPSVTYMGVNVLQITTNGFIIYHNDGAYQNSNSTSTTHSPYRYAAFR